LIDLKKGKLLVFTIFLSFASFIFLTRYAKSTEGKVKSIGVSNWRKSNLERMESLGQELPTVNQVCCEARTLLAPLFCHHSMLIVPVFNKIEVHVGYHEDDLIKYCQEKNIVVQAASPLARFV
jgi:diketogulonate reductase-like aldo/keto reductase